MPNRKTIMLSLLIFILLLLTFFNVKSTVMDFICPSSVVCEVVEGDCLEIVYYPSEIPSLRDICLSEGYNNKEATEPKEKTQKEIIDGYVDYVCSSYSNVSPDLIKHVIMSESSYNPNAKNGNHVGLMQISTKWHSKRARSLGVQDLYDPCGNVLVGTDYLSELIEQTNGDVAWALMIYNMGFSEAYRLHRNRTVSSYASTILSGL